MKILHATNAVGWSGGMEQMAILIRELGRLGHESVLVCPQESELIAKASGPAVRVRPLAMAQDYDLIAAWKLRRMVRQDRPDVVHAHHAIAHAVALLALSGLPAPPLVVSRRVSFSPRRNPFSRWKYRSGRIQAYSAVSASVKATLVRGGVAPEKVRVIYSALDPERFSQVSPRPGLKKELDIPDGCAVVGKLANCSRWKGQHVFLEAARLCLQKNRRIVFVLIGKGTEALAPDARALGLGSQVRLLGFRPDAHEVLSLLDLSVNSAIEGEGLSGAMRESLALGVPVIASDVAGNREIVRDGEFGTLVPPQRPELLAEKILAALQDEGGMRRRAQAGRAWVRQNASAEKMASDFLELYRSLAGRR